jgi:hypothetical protein
MGDYQGRVRKAFFSEEKKQKTFIFGARGKIPAMASIVGAAEKQKSFGSFLQKRTSCLKPGLGVPANLTGLSVLANY